MAAMMGGGVVEDARADETAVEVESADETIDDAALPSPEEQVRILNPEELELRSEMPIALWECSSGHRVKRYDGEPKPASCPECRAVRFGDDPIESVEVAWYRLRLAFSRHDERKRRVWDRLEHVRAVIVAEMTRLDAGANATPAWLETHKGYLEVALAAPATRTAIRETLQYLAECSTELIDGIPNPNLTIAGLSFLNMLKKRSEEIEASRKEQRPPGA